MATRTQPYADFLDSAATITFDYDDVTLAFQAVTGRNTSDRPLNWTARSAAGAVVATGAIAPGTPAVPTVVVQNMRPLGLLVQRVAVPRTNPTEFAIVPPGSIEARFG